MNSLTRLSLALDAGLMPETLGLETDPWQLRVLRSGAKRILLLCARQCGKSTTTAILALHTALFFANSLVLLLSPSLRQSGELFKKLTGYYQDLGRPLVAEQETALTLTLENRSRVVSLPSKESTIRGYSAVRLLIVDEAARVSDDLFQSVTPMLAVSGGRMVCLSTPFGKRGFFYESWTGSEPWERVKVLAHECSRIPASFLDAERRSKGPRWFAQEYECSFEEVEDAVFTHDIIHAAVRDDIEPIILR